MAAPSSKFSNVGNPAALSHPTPNIPSIIVTAPESPRVVATAVAHADGPDPVELPANLDERAAALQRQRDAMVRAVGPLLAQHAGLLNKVNEAQDALSPLKTAFANAYIAHLEKAPGGSVDLAVMDKFHEDLQNAPITDVHKKLAETIGLPGDHVDKLKSARARYDAARDEFDAFMESPGGDAASQFERIEMELERAHHVARKVAMAELQTGTTGPVVIHQDVQPRRTPSSS